MRTAVNDHKLSYQNLQKLDALLSEVPLERILTLCDLIQFDTAEDYDLFDQRLADELDELDDYEDD